MQITTQSENDMLELGARLASSIPQGCIIFLEGELGAGKTTFTRGLLRGFGYDGKVKSPTYTLVEPYVIAEKHIYHFDLYRLKDPTELEYIGIHEYFLKDNICIVEWPQQGLPLLPAPDLTCYIEMKESERLVTLTAGSRRGKEILAVSSRGGR